MASERSRENPQEGRTDKLAAVGLALVGGALSWALSGWFGELAPHLEFENIYFQADINSVYENMVVRSSNHHRTSGHPLFSLLAFIPAALFRALGFGPVESVRAVLALVAALAVAGFFTLLRRLSFQRLDAVLLSALLLSSSAFVFWTTVPETFAFGGLSILIAACFYASRKAGERGFVAQVAVNVVTVAFTVTNWMIAGIGTILSVPFKRAIKIFALAAVATLALWGVQRASFQSSGAPGDVRRYVKYLRAPTLDDPVMFAIGGVVAPKPAVVPVADGRVEFSAERGTWSAGGVATVTAVGAWLGLLALGAFTTVRERRTTFGTTLGALREQRPRGLEPLLSVLRERLSGPFEILLLTLLGQFILHLGFGDGPFLYTMHYGPLLMVLAGQALLGRFRRVALGLLIVLIPLSAFSNIRFQREVASTSQERLVPWFEAKSKEGEVSRQ